MHAMPDVETNTHVAVVDRAAAVSGPKPGASPALPSHLSLVMYLVLGALFGIVLTKSEVISWFRIQEMFRFQAFHMYGVIGSAVLTAALSLQAIKRLALRSLDGQQIALPPKSMGSGIRYWLGGTLFGLGWALVGACPGPLFALLGNGVGVIAVPLVSAVAGTWIYGALRPALPL
jgi:uncharacterized membrane protein YedE/YeeE